MLEKLLAQRRLILSVSFCLLVIGALAWSFMPRREDPLFPDRSGLVTVSFPGADAEVIERLVVEPIEDRLAQVAEISKILSTARAGLALVQIELSAPKDEVDAIWDRVRERLAEARVRFPQGAGEPLLNRDLTDIDSVVLAVTAPKSAGTVDLLLLRRAADDLRRDLLHLPGVSRAELVGDPGEQVSIELDGTDSRLLGVDPRLIARELGRRAAVIPGSSVDLHGKTVVLEPSPEFSSIGEIESTPIPLSATGAVPLGEIASVAMSVEDPPTTRMRYGGREAVGVAVVFPQEGIDLIRYGRNVREYVETLRPRYAPLEIEEVFFQPRWVEQRLEALKASLLQSIVIVLGVLWFSMGSRLGVIVGAVIPLVVLASLALFAAGGGELHQISIASFVMALGLLVDNAIVVSEDCQSLLDQGVGPTAAPVRSARKLLPSLGVATGTTVAAFVPMLLSEGDVADYTRALPVVMILTISLSYIFSIVVTPVLCGLLLRPHHEPWLDAATRRLGRWLGELAVRRPGWVLAGTAVVVAGCLILGSGIPLQFFPSADRPQIVVDLKLPEGTHLSATEEAAKVLEKALLGRRDVVRVSSFIGRGAPHFFYNVPPTRPHNPHLAQVVVEVAGLPSVSGVLSRIRQLQESELAGVQVVARQLEQGPVFNAPIEVRVKGQDLGQLAQATDRLVLELRTIPGARDVRHDLSVGVPKVRLMLRNEAAAYQAGFTRGDIAESLLGSTSGLEVGEFRAGREPIPIRLRTKKEARALESLSARDLYNGAGDSVPLSAVADLEVSWRPAAIYHYNRLRYASISAEIEEGSSFSQIVGELQRRLEHLSLPPEVEVQLGGVAEGSGEANRALLSRVPLGVAMILGFLLAEFGSFRRVGIVLLTIPLAVVGVVPGLVVSGEPFGFMSLLGAVALIGIVVNDGIILLDGIEAGMAGEGDRWSAVIEAVSTRCRPILLTTVTTVVGMIPLALSKSSLWPPLAWAMISGLISSTLLTLLVIPASFVLAFRR